MIKNNLRNSLDLRKLAIYSMALSFLTLSCNSNFTPRPTGYYKIDFPEKQYKVFDTTGFPYSFEYPVYAKIIKDTSFFGDQPENPWWINIEFPSFNGRIYISYKEIGLKSLDTLINQAFTLTNRHASRAYSIEDSVMLSPNGIGGVFFKVGGNVATSNQFFLTDSLRHFLRGALYFDAAPNLDSLGIVNQFILEDMKHLINTFKWKSLR